MAQLMPLPLTVSCFSKIQIGFIFLVPTHLSSLGKEAVKTGVCVRACVRACVRSSCRPTNSVKALKAHYLGLKVMNGKGIRCIVDLLDADCETGRRPQVSAQPELIRSTHAGEDVQHAT